MLANLYRDHIDFCHYWPDRADIPCYRFLSQANQGRLNWADYKFLSIRQVEIFKLVLQPEAFLPEIPVFLTPQPMSSGLYPVNEPEPSSPVIVSGNNRLTFELLMTIWAQGLTPAYFLILDSLGHTVDMAMIFQTFSPERLRESLEASGLEKIVAHRRLILPGLSGALHRQFSALTGWEIEIGPVCALELPLFLGEHWILPARQ